MSTAAKAPWDAQKPHLEKAKRFLLLELRKDLSHDPPERARDFRHWSHLSEGEQERQQQCEGDDEEDRHRGPQKGMLSSGTRRISGCSKGTISVRDSYSRQYQCALPSYPMLDAVATIVLAGMMFIPIINLVVGILAGASMFGFPGGIAGAALAFLITIAQKQIPWRRHIKLGARIIDFPSRRTAAVLSQHA
jgi:hypothetical protein